MRRALFLVVVALAAGCIGGGSDEELQPGTVRIGVVQGEQIVAEGARVAVAEINNAGGIQGVVRIVLVHGSADALLRRGVRFLVLPCRRGVLSALQAAERVGAVAVAPCDDGELPRRLRRTFTAGLSPGAQAAALESYAGGKAARVLPAETARGRRVAAFLDLRTGGSRTVSPDAPEAVTPPPGAPDGTVYATYGFPDPGNEADEFYERYRALYGRRPDSIVSALAADAVDVLASAIDSAESTEPGPVADEIRRGISLGGVLAVIEFNGGTNRALVDAAIVRVDGSRLRYVAKVR
jgi:ABC-type branched-subunit amino acid transport system substrate-binding protein